MKYLQLIISKIFHKIQNKMKKINYIYKYKILKDYIQKDNLNFQIKN